MLSPLPAEEWGDAEYEAFGALLGAPGDQVPRAGSGHRYDPLHFDVVGVLVRHPAMAREFLRFNAFLGQRGELEPRLRELAILRVAARERSAYEWAEHVRIAADTGCCADEIDRAGAGPAGFDGDDRLVLEATDELVDAGRLSAATWSSLADRLGERAAIELLFVVGTYRMLAASFTTWDLQPRPGSAPLRD